MKKNNVAVIIPNWNGEEYIEACIDSLTNQTYTCDIIVVENGSIDASVDILRKKTNTITLLEQQTNHGFAEGVNIGIRHAINKQYAFIALINNDAVVDKNWLAELVKLAKHHSDAAIITSRITSYTGDRLDSTGDFYTRWGLPYPRGRGELSDGKYIKSEEVFGASGGASLYRVSALKQIGLFDKVFFAYFEDVDISYRARLYGWRIFYCATAIAYHKISATSNKIRGFAVYQTFKNYLLVFIKNTPFTLLLSSFFFTILIYFALIINAIKNGNGVFACRGFFAFLRLIPHALSERRKIQKSKVINVSELKNWITFDVPKEQTGILKIKKILKL